MTELDLMQTYLVPILYVVYAIALLVKPPKMGATWGFCAQRAQKSEAAWKYAQRVSGLYCGAGGIVLFLVIGLIRPPYWVQLVAELAVLGGIYPVVTGLLKKKFPD